MNQRGRAALAPFLTCSSVTNACFVTKVISLADKLQVQKNKSGRGQAQRAPANSYSNQGISNKETHVFATHYPGGFSGVSLRPFLEATFVSVSVPVTTPVVSVPVTTGGCFSTS